MSEIAIYTPKSGESRYIRRAWLMRHEDLPSNRSAHYVIRLGVRSGRRVDWIYRFDGRVADLYAGQPYALTGEVDVENAVGAGKSVVVEVVEVGAPPSLHGTALHLVMGCDVAAVVKRGGSGGSAAGLDTLVSALSVAGVLDKDVVVHLTTPTESGSDATYPTVLDANGSTVEVVSTVTETTVYSFSIPANTLAVGRGLRLWMHGDALVNAAGVPAFTLKIKYGATTLYDDVSAAAAASASRMPFVLSLVLAANAATNAQTLGGVMLVGTQGGATSGLGDLAVDEILVSTPLHGTSAEDATTTLTLTVTVTWDASSSTRSFRKKYACLEIV